MTGNAIIFLVTTSDVVGVLQGHLQRPKTEKLVQEKTVKESSGDWKESMKAKQALQMCLFLFLL